MPIQPELLGPYALTAALLIGFVSLWRDHLRADADDRAQRDRAMDIAAAQVEATNRVAASQAELAKALSEYIREQSNRQRRADT